MLGLEPTFSISLIISGSDSYLRGAKIEDKSFICEIGINEKEKIMVGNKIKCNELLGCIVTAKGREKKQILKIFLKYLEDLLIHKESL